MARANVQRVRGEVVRWISVGRKHL